MCQVLSRAGSELIGVSVWTMWNPKFAAASFGAGALSLLASNYLCPEMPMGGTEPNPNLDGCQEVNGYGDLEALYNGQWSLAFPPGHNYFSQGRVAVEIVEQYIYQSVDTQWVNYIGWRMSDGRVAGSTDYRSYSEDVIRAIRWRINPTEGTCIRGSNEPQPIPPEATEPIEYTDNITNCTYNVTLQGFAQESEGGAVNPVLLIESASGTRSDGGVMGGCNFEPTIYMPGGGGGGGGVYVPVPPDPPAPDGGVPWWVPALAGALGGAVANQVIEAINDALAPTFNPASFTLTAPCDVDENGQQLTRTWEFLEGTFQERMNAHQVALMEILQQHLDWRTPTCSSQLPQVEGEWITTRWESDEQMDHSGRRLRKLFRYRSKSSRELQQLSSYWESFVWRSGPVCVKHKGAWWGYPQVWAESAEEGKRVIRFAGAEAGLDPDQVGRWEIGGSRSPRYGMSGTMRILQHRGFPWVASRDGADWPNILAKEP